MAWERPRFEAADVVRAHGDDYRRAHRPSAAQERVLRNIAACRTAALGGHIDECEDGCGFARISYNSCRDRHCPKCQGPQRAAWLEKRLERLLPVPYFHVVFTIPDALNPLALRNKAVVYKILFEAASKTLLELTGDPKRLGATIGVTAVLPVDPCRRFRTLAGASGGQSPPPRLNLTNRRRAKPRCEPPRARRRRTRSPGRPRRQAGTVTFFSRSGPSGRVRKGAITSPG